MQDYNGAELIFKTLDNDYPELPLGKIYLAANKIAQAYDYAEDFDETFILNNLDAARVQAKELIINSEVNIWHHYFLALSEGYTSYFDGITGNWLSAISTGVNSISEFEDILQSNNKFYEAYIAIGTFEYWKSRKLEFIDWFPFSSDTKGNSIEHLIIAIDSSSYNSHLAINSLIWIYIDQSRYEEAIDLAEEALNNFPESRTFKWGLARAYEDKNPAKAIELYLEILSSYPLSLKENFINEITLKHIIAQQYEKLGDKLSAIKYCEEILSIKNIPPKAIEQLSGRLDRVKSLKNELSKKK
jgi:tetratricopeptide (TPR) repeat protein